jgi:uncharacterized protein
VTPVDLGVVSAFAVGLLGGVHCAAMCGGIVGALATQSDRAPVHFHLAYSAGRIASYTLAGALAGWIGSSAFLLEGMLPAERVLYLVANVVLIGMGLYLAGLSRAILWLERPGAAVWRALEPLARPLFPVRSAAAAAGVGAVWGFLPCGMVYTVLVGALAAHDPATGAAMLAAFGLGTLPNVLAIGLLAQRVNAWRRIPQVRMAAGALIVAFGIAGIVRGDHAGHVHHHPHDAGASSVATPAT